MINTVEVRSIMIMIIRDVLLSPYDGGYVHMGLDDKRKGEMVVWSYDQVEFSVNLMVVLILFAKIIVFVNMWIKMIDTGYSDEDDRWGGYAASCGEIFPSSWR